MYGKIINDILHFAPRKIVIDNTLIINPTDEQLTQAGYKEVIFTDCQYNDKYISSWEQTETQIIQHWTKDVNAIMNIPLEEQITDIQLTIAELYESLIL